MKSFILKNIYIAIIILIAGIMAPVVVFAKNICFSFPEGLVFNDPPCFSIPDIPPQFQPTDVPQASSNAMNSNIFVSLTQQTTQNNNNNPQTYQQLDISMSGFKPQEKVDMYLNGTRKHIISADHNGSVHFTSQDATDIQNLSTIHMVGEISGIQGDWRDTQLPLM